MGICHVASREASRDAQGRFYDGAKVRGGMEAWAKSAAERMQAWGFNTAGAWCEPALYEQQPLFGTRVVWLGIEVDGIKHPLLHVFSAGYEEAIDKLCAEQVAAHRDDPRLIGWMLDNELPWFGAHGWPEDPHRSLLDLALELPAGDANRVEMLKFLRKEYTDFEAFAQAWQTSAKTWDELATVTEAPRARGKRADLVKARWAGHVADRFFTVCAGAVRRYDPNHLILGTRFAGQCPGPVLASCARHCDVVTINVYLRDGDPRLAWWDQMYAVVQKPILITEFSWRATENRTGNRNTLGADVTVATQRERAEKFRSVVAQIMARPFIVGMHWFQWADEPEHGRAFDGEDSNYGLVDWQDEAYEELTSAARDTHAALPKPDTRGGELPAAADREGLAWGVKPPPLLPEGKLAAPADLTTAAPFISLDEKTGARAAAQQQAGAWKVDFDSGRGWGFNVEWAPPKSSLAGAQRVRIACDAPAGTQFQIVFFEQGDNDPAYAGQNADGECWLLGPVGSGTTELDLRDADLNAYHGNPRGNRRIDLDGLRTVGVYVGGNQKAGELRVKEFKLLP